MNQHPVSWENLVDWLDGRLGPQEARELEEHLGAGCPSCEEDVAWLRRFRAASAVAGPEVPPLEAVRRAKAAYRSGQPRTRRAGPTWWPARLPRLAPVLAALLVVMVIAAYLFQTAVVFARQAVLATAGGTVEVRPAAGDRWEAIATGARVREGDRVRVAGGQAALTLFDGSTVELEPGAQVTLSSLRSGLPGGAYRVAVYQEAGTVRYDVPALRRSRSVYHVESPTARISVQGTTFVVIVDGTGETRVAVLRGVVSVAGALDSMVLGESQAAVIRAQAPVRLSGDVAPGAARTPGAAPRATQAPRPHPTQGQAPGETQHPGPTRQGTATAPRPSSTETSPTPQAGETPGMRRTVGPTATRRAQGPTLTSTPTGQPAPNATPRRSP